MYTSLTQASLANPPSHRDSTFNRLLRHPLPQSPTQQEQCTKSLYKLFVCSSGFVITSFILSRWITSYNDFRLL